MKLHSDLIRKLADMMLEGYIAEKDPVVTKLKRVVDAIKSNDWSRAKTFLDEQLRIPMTERKNWYKNIPALKGIWDVYSEAIRLIDVKDPAAAEKVTEIIDTLKKNEKEISTALQGLVQ